MPKQPPQTGWEKQAKVALRDGDALTALRTLEGASLHAKLQPRFPYFYSQPGGSGACEVLSNVSHREINFERLTCCQFAQILTQMRQLVGVICSYVGSVLKAIAVRLHALGIKIVPEFAYRMPDQFKQPDKIHLTAEGHMRLATPLLPFVIKALTPT